MQFDHLVRRLQALDTHLYDIALYQNGVIQAHAFQPCNRGNNVYSVAKAFVVTALGLLHDAGKLDVQRPLADYLAEEFDRYRPATPWREVRVEHAITHTIGFDRGFLDIDVEDAAAYPSDDYLQLVFSHPLAYAPGAQRQYSDAAYYLLSRLVEKLADQPLDRLLHARVMAPLRFAEAAWSRCPQGHPIGATGLYISACDMVKLGALYLQDGVYAGQRILSSQWVQTVLARQYEFTRRGAGSLYAKEGMYGQGLAFCTACSYAVAWHAHEEDPQKRRQVLAVLQQEDG